MWAIIRASLLGTEILSVEIGHQDQQPKIEPDDDDGPTGITGGTSMAGFDRRPVEDVQDTDGWLPKRLGFNA